MQQSRRAARCAPLLPALLQHLVAHERHAGARQLLALALGGRPCGGGGGGGGEAPSARPPAGAAGLAQGVAAAAAGARRFSTAADAALAEAAPAQADGGGAPPPEQQPQQQQQPQPQHKPARAPPPRGPGGQPLPTFEELLAHERQLLKGGSGPRMPQPVHAAMGAMLKRFQGHHSVRDRWGAAGSWRRGRGQWRAWGSEVWPPGTLATGEGVGSGGGRCPWSPPR
jgi:hypothetical protein